MSKVKNNVNHQIIATVNLGFQPMSNMNPTNNSAAIMMIANGVDLRTVSKRLGHSNMSTTANIYTHAVKSADERAAEVLQDILKPKQKNNKAN